MAQKTETENLPPRNGACDSSLDCCSEEQLMRALQSGNGDALGVIFDRYHRLVLVTAVRILHDIGEAEDLMQSVFFEIFQKAAQFDPAKGTLNKWILQYAYHRSINRKNYLVVRQFYRSIDLPDADRPELWTTKIQLPTQEATRLAREGLALLNERQREVMELVFFGEMTLQEIADQTKQSFGTVRHHYYRGLRQLRDLLSVSPNVNEEKVIVPLKEVGGANA
jgi:RNA polymerase sigma-70 factor, ECF subfamily